MTTQNKTLTKPQAAKRELREWLQGEDFRRELAALLPRQMSPERFVRISFQAIHRNPDLLKCTQESFFNCLLQLGAMGLEPDGRRAHLIPFGLECTLIVDYKGIKELVRRNRDVSAMAGNVVHENDEFELRFGTRGILDHKPNLQNPGKAVCVYSWVKLPDGNEEYDVMSIAEVDRIRNRSRSPNKGPWVTDFEEMAKKTVFRRHAKSLPLSPETRDALERDQDADALTEAERFAAAAPARAANVLGNSAHQRGAGAARTRDRAEASETGEGEQEPAEPQSAPGPIRPAPPAPVSQAAPASELVLEPDQASVVRGLLAEAGYSEAELLKLMKIVKMAPADAKNLDETALQHLVMVSQDWGTCIERMREMRKLGEGK